MSVFYQFFPVDPVTASPVAVDNASPSLHASFSSLAELMINFPDQFLDYFEKHELTFDFIYSLKESEVSTTTYQAEQLKWLFKELLEILQTREGFPIPVFRFFNYENRMEGTALAVNLKGSELNKLVTDNGYFEHGDFEISTSFDNCHNYSLIRDEFIQTTPTVYVTTEENERFKSELDLSAFPGVITINHTHRNINLGRAIQQITLVAKTPYEHFLPMFTNLIATCDACMAKGYALKSRVSF